jgi:hypothetical protein
MQFSLRTGPLAVTGLCVTLGTWVVPAERQRRAVASIRAFGGQVEYAEKTGSKTETFVKAILRRCLPQDYLSDVHEVHLAFTAGTDASAAVGHLHGLTGLRRLAINHALLTDHALGHLHGLRHLEET